MSLSRHRRGRRADTERAAIAILGTSGIYALSHRAVDEPAELPAGTVLGRLRADRRFQTGPVAVFCRVGPSQKSQFPGDLFNSCGVAAALPARCAKISIGRMWPGCSPG